MIDYARGIDVSRWQGDFDWYDPDLCDVQFAIVKLSDGMKRACRSDQHLAGLHEVCIMPGVYHLWQPMYPGAAQARVMLRLLPSWYGDCIPPALDIETKMIDKPPIASHDVSSMVAWGVEVRNALKCKPLLYISPRGLRHLEREQKGVTEILPSYFELWLCDYDRIKGDRPAPGEKPDGIAPWADWRFWQYTSSLDGKKHGAESRRLDGDLYHGTTSNLYTWTQSCWD